MKKIVILISALIFILLSRDLFSQAQNPGVLTQISQMSLDQKIGQIIIGGFNGQILNTETKKLISVYYIGGFNILGRNVKNSAQSKKLFSDLQKLAKKNELPALLIAADQEGSQNRFKFLKELTPQSKIKTEISAKKVAEKRAAELKSLGVNMIFSPVLDYVSDAKAYLYKRTFQKSPTETTSLGKAMIRGYLSEGVIAVPKHFPGYGNIKSDPHYFASQTSDSTAEKSVEIFKNISTSSVSPALMTAHIIMPAIDNKPATLSSKIIGNLLKKEIGYKGLVISDELEMASASQEQGIGRVAVEAFKAGHDMLIISLSPSKIPTAVAALKKAFESGELSQKQLDLSIQKILELKLKYIK